MNGNVDWNLAVERLGPRLYNYFLRRGFLRESSDMTQEVFSRLYQKLVNNQFDETKGTLDAFTFGIARFVALENHQNSQIYIPNSQDFDWETIIDTSESADIESEYQRNQIIELFLREIKSLNPIQQDVLTLYMDEEMSLEDISALLKIPVGTVKSHLHRSKEKLKVLLEAKGISL